MIVMTEEMRPKTVMASAPDILALQVPSCVHNNANTTWEQMDI